MGDARTASTSISTSEFDPRGTFETRVGKSEASAVAAEIASPTVSNRINGLNTINFFQESNELA
jgi:hypothetical protein